MDDSTAVISSFLVDHHEVLLVGGVLSSVAAPCLVWLIAGLAAAVRRTGECALAALAFGAGVAAVVLVAASDAISVTLTQLAWIGEPSFLKSGYVLSAFFLQKAFWFAAFVAVAVSLAARRAEALPRWYEWASTVAGALFALGGIAMKPEGFFAVGGGMALVAFLALLGWVLATSLLLWREPEHGEAAAPVTAPS